MTAPEFALTLWNTVGPHLDIFGILGLSLGFASGVMPQRNWILLTSAACATCFALHYVHLGALTGTAMCAVSALQSLASARFVRPERRAAWVGPFFVASSLLAAWLMLATWNGWPSACAGMGALLATAARLQPSPQAMRRLFLGASTCWAAHNLLVHSAFGLTCDLLTISGLAIALLRARQPRLITTAKDTALKPALAGC